MAAFAQQNETLTRAGVSQRNAGERWRMKGRQTPGQNAAALRARALKQKLQLRSTRIFAAAGASGAWTSLGPAALPSDASGMGLQDYNYVSGRATAVAIDPNDSSGNTVFAGGAYGGIWKSSNAGAASTNPASVNWTPLTDEQATLAIGSIAIQPQASNANPNASIVLAGTGETNGSADSYYGLGILRSADGGQTWTLISQDATGAHPFAGLGFSKIAFSAANPALVVAAAASATQGIIEGLEDPVAVNRGIYYSTDAGVTWNAANLADAGVNIAPSSVTSVVYNAAAGQFYAAIRFHGFYSSPDGANWTRLPSQPGSNLTSAACPSQTAQPSSCPIYRGEIAVVPNRTGAKGLGEMYLWSVDADDNDQGIWQSLDGGNSWTPIDDSGIANCGDLLGGCGTAQGTFNLALAAVPDGTATDLYAGAVNLYKCLITNASPACAGTGNNTFLNLTHVYGCSAIARVHPNYHAIDFAVTGGAALLYLANDGGIYRALDGYSGLLSGSCGQTNQFDSLNATLGPLTQFVSIAQSATDPNLIFGGSEGNGAPATAFSQSSGSWVNVDGGDNGFTAVSPANENEWLLSTPPDSISGVNLLSCSNGVNCHTQDFQDNQIADSDQLGGDTGPFNLPFIFDPATSTSVLIGTCRIWRGSAAGGGFSLLSPDFETGGTGACTGNEINLVRNLAAGGPTDSSGLSQVIYAGTSGEGPNVSTTPGGGRVWVTTNADAGPTSWSDQTGAINPNHFPISGIALDPADPTGNTAYVTVMGFNTSHVWQTTNAGATWTDFSANLPDAPVDSIVIAPGASGSPSTIFVGTDVGVFSSSTSAANWIEVDPQVGQSGFLPNVAVTSLQIFKSGGLLRLRAGTYGRGIWEWNLITTPDFQLTVADNPLTAFAGTNATFNGTITALNGYSSAVDLNCVSGSSPAPQTCSASPASVVPSANGTSFTVSASDVPGDYSFAVQGIGTDSAATTHSFALVLHVIDFALSTPLPETVNLIAGATSAPVSFSVTAAGEFDQPVTLGCTGLPQGASCAFQPSDSVTPTAAAPVNASVTISTSAPTPTGNYSISLTGSTAEGPVKMQTLNLAVGGAPNYSLAVANPSLTTQVNSPAVFNGTLTSVNGYNSAVTLSCGAGAPPSCAVNPSTISPTASGVQFTVTASSSVSQAYSFALNAVGSDPAGIAQSVSLALSVLPAQSFDFSMGVNPQSATVPVGEATTFTVDVNPTTGSFPNAVTFSCANLPALTTCTFNPIQVGAGAGNSVTALSLSTTAPSTTPDVRGLAAISLLPFAGLFWASLRPRHSRRRQHRLIAALLLTLACISCGGGLQGNGSTGGSGIGSPGTPLGTYNITLTANTGAVAHSTQVSLTVQ